MGLATSLAVAHDGAEARQGASRVFLLLLLLLILYLLLLCLLLLRDRRKRSSLHGLVRKSGGLSLGAGDDGHGGDTAAASNGRHETLRETKRVKVGPFTQGHVWNALFRGRAHRKQSTNMRWASAARCGVTASRNTRHPCRVWRRVCTVPVWGGQRDLEMGTQMMCFCCGRHSVGHTGRAIGHAGSKAGHLAGRREWHSCWAKWQ